MLKTILISPKFFEKTNTLMREVFGKSATECKRTEDRVEFLLISRIHQVLNMD